MKVSKMKKLIPLLLLLFSVQKSYAFDFWHLVFLDQATSQQRENEALRDSINKASYHQLPKTEALATASINPPESFTLGGEGLGARTKIYDLGWVTVKNLEPVYSCNTSFIFGNECVNEYGGVIEVIGTKDNGETYLCKLIRVGGDGIAGGTVCPRGTLFYLSKETFELQATLVDKEEQRIANEKAEVESLIRTGKSK